MKGSSRRVTPGVDTSHSQAWQTRRNHELHLQRLNNIRPQMNFDGPADLPHIRNNAKRALQLQRVDKTRRKENGLLLTKLNETIRRNDEHGRQSSLYTDQIQQAVWRRKRLTQRSVDNSNMALVGRLRGAESDYAPERLEKVRAAAWPG